MAGGSAAARASEEVYEGLNDAFMAMPTNPEQALDKMMPVLFPPEFITQHPELKAMMLAGFKIVPATPQESIERTKEAVLDFDTYDRLPQINCPVMIVHGEQDMLVPPANAALIKSRIPQAEVFMIPNAGHSYGAADPMGIHQRIVSWLKT
jgi:3-oxoadipate enol-lactonase